MNCPGTKGYCTIKQDSHQSRLPPINTTRIINEKCINTTCTIVHVLHGELMAQAVKQLAKRHQQHQKGKDWLPNPGCSQLGCCISLPPLVLLTMAAQIQKAKKLQLFKSMISLINWDFRNVCEAEKKPNKLKLQDSLWLWFC